MVETDLLLCVSINDEASLYIYMYIYSVYRSNMRVWYVLRTKDLQI